jgi:RNA polymerase sigma-70 factor (ECF subfamily)
VIIVHPQERRPSEMSESRHTAVNYEAVLLECAAGNQAAVARLYADERRNLRKVAWRIVRNHDRAEDVIHDAFAQILRDAKSFDPARGSARGWVYAIVRNTALRNLHNTGQEVPVEDERLLSICDHRQQEHADLASRPAEYAELRHCLERMEPKRRASLVLAIVDGRTHAEIAQCLGVPVGTVKAWIRRELIALRKQLNASSEPDV